MAARRRHFLVIAVAVSVAVHLVAALLVVFLPRVMPREVPPQEKGAVELLMVEQKGARPSQAGQPQQSQPTPPQPQRPTEASKEPSRPTEPQAAAAQPKPAPPVPQSPDETAPPPTEETPPKAAKADEKPAPQADEKPAPQPTEKPAPQADEKPAQQQAAAPPTPPPSPQAPVFDLAGTESESNAVVLGSGVLPASPDNRFRNRPPVFPREAEMRGEHGSVVVLIHVSERGVADGVDVARSSGVASLDQAAVDAVRKWHFRPAMREGRAVPFDMPFEFVFEAD